MKFIVSLSGLLLIFLLPHWTQSVENEAVDIQTLAKIINFFELNYKRVDADGHPRQYATAINVPKVQCQAGFNPSQKNFLTQEDAKNVRNVIGDESTALYQGQQLIAAGNKNREHPKKKNEIVQIHSESLLLNPPKNPPGNSPMTNLLNRNKQNCSVFYTLNSPCVDTCLNEKGPYSILKALDSWKKHSGIKAFVFKEFWKFDLEKDLQSKFKLVASRVPLYRCVTETKCYACKGEGNDPIDQTVSHQNKQAMSYCDE